jgi:acetoin utilization protein AcuB
MTKETPTIGRSMTVAKHWVAPGDTLVAAKALMEAHTIRHLPVLEGTTVVGVVTMSDLFVMEATFAADPEKTTVEEAMSRDVYTVAPSEPLENVAREMARRYIGSAIVLEDGKLVGLFTTTDACRILAEVLASKGRDLA